MQYRNRIVAKTCKYIVLTANWLNKLKEVSAAVIIENEAVLLARRSPNEKLASFWELLGGKIEGNETPQQCLEREIQEELGVSSTAGDVFFESVFEYDHQYCLG